MKTLSIYTDGGARGNPGPAAVGVYVEQEGKEIKSIGKRIGETTNNSAEYLAILEALKWVDENKKSLGFDRINFFMDSELASSQLNGLYKIKNPHIRNFISEIRKLEGQIEKPIVYKHVGREQNKIADRLVNAALDNRL